jgi:hypothetical protein
MPALGLAACPHVIQSFHASNNHPTLFAHTGAEGTRRGDRSVHEGQRALHPRGRRVEVKQLVLARPFDAAKLVAD